MELKISYCHWKFDTDGVGTYWETTCLEKEDINFIEAPFRQEGKYCPLCGKERILFERDTQMGKGYTSDEVAKLGWRVI